MKPIYAPMLLLAALTVAGCGGGESKAAAAKTAEASAVPSQPAAAAPALDLAKGKQVYETTCAACHGLTGKGDGVGAAALDPKPRDFSDKAYMSKLADADIRNTIKYGGGIKGMPQMPSHPQFGDAELAALVAHIRTMSK